MTTALIVGAVVLVVLVTLVAAAAGRRRQPTDDIASFRRQIDALSPEARRQTSDRMKPSERAASSDDGADDT
jgi:HAMP domain-containing protein